jgi:hypothetical protein
MENAEAPHTCHVLDSAELAVTVKLFAVERNYNIRKIVFHLRLTRDCGKLPA